MISFPTTLNTGGAHISLPSATPRGIGGLLANMGKSFANSVTNRVLGGVLAFVQGANSKAGPGIGDLTRIPYDATIRPNDIKKRPEAGILPTSQTQFVKLQTSNGLTNQASNYHKPWYEYSCAIDPDIYSMMNTYRYLYSETSYEPIDVDTSDKDKNGKAINQKVYFNEWPSKTLAPSLFNPYYGIQKIGPTQNTPLLDNIDTLPGEIKAKFENSDFTDCSIKKLCELSNTEAGRNELGVATYKYSDFMYCKDLGMPNNRMLTLRRFSMPIGDMIFGRQTRKKDSPYDTPGDIGRLIGYFGTGDNKLEDILNYSFDAKWEERTADWQQLESQEDTSASPLGRLINTMSTGYSEAYMKGMAGGNNILDWVMGSTNKPYSPSQMPTEWNYDKNKVYDPVDTIRSTHLYVGALEFRHEFTLTFDYTLRSYDNINPKAAMLDLLANATAVCYKKGHFWGGRQQVVGAPPNRPAWNKADKMIDGAFNELGGIFQGLSSGNIDINGFFGNLANQFVNKGKEMANDIQKTMQGDKSTTTSKVIKEAKDAGKTFLSNMFGMAKGRVKNYLGRPQMYMFNSLLSGDNVGLWHLTIGNPRNPIAVMGNLILTDAKIQHYGPLGQDDFPTGLRITVTLKHARPRDMVEIQKMYTRGIMGIYQNIKFADKMNSDNKGQSFSFRSHVKSDLAYNDSSSDGIASLPDMYWGEFDEQKIKRNVDEIL